MHDNREFDQLFAAFANADVTEQERQRLGELAGQDVGRRGALAEVEAIHELFAVEAAMRHRIMQPVEAAEEGDESYRRLAQAAALAGEKLRAHMQHPTAVPKESHVLDTSHDADLAERPKRWWLYAMAIAAVVLVSVTVGLWLPGDGSPKNGAPSLSNQAPDSKVLGSRAIDVTTLITDDSKELSWSEVDAAASYEVSILDAENAVILRRAEGRRFTRWLLTHSEMSLLREHRELFVSVVAKDRGGEEVGWSGGGKALPLHVR